MSAETIIKAASADVQACVEGILEIEKSYQFYKRLPKTLEKEIEEKISKVIKNAAGEK